MCEKKLFEPVAKLRPGNLMFRRIQYPLLSRPTETWPCGTIQIVNTEDQEVAESLNRQSPLSLLR